jgi:hypothetical protein
VNIDTPLFLKLLQFHPAVRTQVVIFGVRSHPKSKYSAALEIDAANKTVLVSANVEDIAAVR